MHPVGQAIYIFYMHQIFVLLATCIKMANLIFVPLVMADIVILFVLNVFFVFFYFLNFMGADILKVVRRITTRYHLLIVILSIQ